VAKKASVNPRGHSNDSCNRRLEVTHAKRWRRSISAMHVSLPPILDGYEIELLRPELMRAVRLADSLVVLDAADVELISSTGLGMLVAAALIGAERGVRIEVSRPSALFRQSLALTGLGRHLGIAPEPAPV
jgi:anti-anti-sigma factor